ncbi:ATP-binding protein [Pseudorhodoferax sp. LjRoot39]|uniref:AAA family ATPase n=1 Tax=Pseudorhodoferax sp. LjRoot39 TaxID=3342328 RepID=UPI003ECD5C22
MSNQSSPTAASQPDAAPPSARKRRARNTRAVPPLTSAATPFLSLPTVHPLVRRHYRVATSAIEELVDLVEHCVRLLIPGALVHARPRMGKTHAIDYAALHLNRQRPELLVLRMSCEHHRTQFEGPFFNALLAAAGVRDTQPASISQKRFALVRRLSEQLQLRQGHIVVMFCDEAQRLSTHALEWLRDVHDQLAQQGVRLITFLVGQPQLMEHKAQYQLAGDEQIVARFMIEQLHFRGIATAEAAATCLASYDLTRFPEKSGPTFTQFFCPLAWRAGLRLEHSAADLWNAFVQAHASAQLQGAIEIQMDYFTRAVEAVLTSAPDWDSLDLKLGPAHWERAVRESGYVAAQQTVRNAS